MFQDFSEEFDDVVFLKVDVDANDVSWKYIIIVCFVFFFPQSNMLLSSGACTYKTFQICVFSIICTVLADVVVHIQRVA